jgi:peptidoglycan/xylan/chitin deacetylase (PgdA/CDA1 family)
MEHRIAAVIDLVSPYGCGATLPITAAVVERHPDAIRDFAAQGIEFPIHGLWHVDHAALSGSQQIAQLARARQVFERHGLPIVGFRAPYLRWNDATLDAIRENGFYYDGSQAMAFPVGNGLDPESYRRVLDFCGALRADDYPVVPFTEESLVRIPYVLPDDETMLDRLRVVSPEEIANHWLECFWATHRRGELFTLAVHPERIELCSPGITAVLAESRRARPPVWTARHEEIARWWHDRARAHIVVTHARADRLCLSINGPVGLTVLARGLDIRESEPWVDGYRVVHATHLTLDVACRPFIGVDPSVPESLTSFLREQGYIVESSDQHREYAYFIDREHFSRKDQRGLVDEIETGAFPLLRFGRWPHACRSALSITGDIDALTIADYVYRVLGH